MAGAGQAVGQRTSDLVLDSKLQTTFHKNYTKHVIDVAGPNVHQRMTTQEQRWRRRKPLGRGTFGEVWLEELSAGQSSVTQRAVKVIERHTSVDYSRELEAFAKFSHRKYARCFVESFGWYQDEKSVFITMEYIPLGDLQDYMSAMFLETELQQISYQLLEGLSFMHENGFAHRDLKPGNILVRSTSPHWWVKIGDFGISKRAEEGMTALRTNSGTRGFMAPEIYAQEGLLDFDNIGELRGYTVAVDLWSLGEIVFRAFTKEPPFARNLAAYVVGRAQFPSTKLQNCGVSDDGCNFIASLMRPNPKDRLTASGGLEHRWVATQKPESPRSSEELQRSSESSNYYGWRKPTDGSEATFKEPSNVWSTNDTAAPVSGSSAHMAHSTAYLTPTKQEPESSHHIKSLPIREKQDQQAVVTTDLASRTLRQTKNITGKRDKKTEIVVGMALGTLDSGVSWALNHGSKRIRVIEDWPHPHPTVSTTNRVPTVISYQNGEPAEWGFMVNGAGGDSIWFIGLLFDNMYQVDQSLKTVLTSIKLLGTLNKTVEDVAADYIRMIWNHTREDIQKVHGDNWEWLHTLRIVLTVPANWPPAASVKIQGAARKAGFQHIDLVMESEAVALAVLQEIEDYVVWKHGDCFVVCDAGRSTVDLISYQVVGLYPLAIAECATPSGELYGSAYLDRTFESLIRSTVGKDQWQLIKEKSKRRMLREFELSIARNYSGEYQQYSVDLVGVEDNVQNRIKDGTITLSPSVLKVTFDHVIDQIMELVHRQIDTVQRQGNEVKAILLVGGFGTSPYMYSQLKDAHKSSEIQLIQSNQVWSSNCRGATLWGLENYKLNQSFTKTVRASIASYSYGLEYENEMVWLLKKGETRKVGQMVHLLLRHRLPTNLFITWMHSLSEKIYYCADDNPPSKRNISVKELCTVDYEIEYSKLRKEEIDRHSITGKTSEYFYVDLCLGVKSGALHFCVIYRDEQLSSMKVNYVE